MDIDALYEAVDARLDATDLAGAAQLLQAVEWDDLDDDGTVTLTELWSALADAYADRARYDDAVGALQRCLDAGVDDPGLRAAQAGYHYQAGREDEARATWEELADQHPADVWVHFAAGVALADADDAEEALPWLTTALEIVVKRGDREGLLADLLGLREEVLADAGEELDDLQERGEALLERGLRQFSSGVRPEREEVAKTAVAWFPPGEYDEAVRRWPDVAEPAGAEDYRGYADDLQRRLVELQRDGAAKLSLAPLFLEAYVTWTEARGLDPDDPASRETYAAEVARLGNEVPWPPGRNDPCWCGSGEKYKKCCAKVA